MSGDALALFLDALVLRAGYNSALVAIGAALLGVAAGTAGTFLVLRKRALLGDAVAHATLPGVCLAFLVMVAAGLDGRNLAGLLVGSAVSAGLGLLAVEAITRHTRLAEDAAIGAVLSVFFGAGIVLLTVIQTLSQGRQAGLEGFLLGSTAGMLYADALTIAAGGAVSLALVLLLRRPMTLVAFDPDFAAATGVRVRTVDRALMGLVLAVTVVGLKVVGLVLVVALLIVPAVTARFWSERVDRVALAAGAIGGASGWIGAAISASAPGLPTGPIIVLVAVGLFVVSLLFAPGRGVLAAALARLAFRRRVHRRQGLLALAHGDAILEPYTQRLLAREGLVRADGVPTPAGRAAAAKARLDEQRWAMLRRGGPDGRAAQRYDGLTGIETVLTRDEIAALDRALGAPQAVEARS